MSEPQPDIAGDDMLTLKQVCAFFGGSEKPIDPSTIYRWVRQGKVPPSYRYSYFSQRWRKSELETALQKMREDEANRLRPKGGDGA